MRSDRVSEGTRRSRRLRLLLPAVTLGIVAFLYYQPLARYVEARNELAARQAEVRELRAERARLELRLERSTSLVALAREARRVGLVRPGEQLFIVKGIPAWRRSHR
jgi:cell division protein FtsB